MLSQEFEPQAPSNCRLRIKPCILGIVIWADRSIPQFRKFLAFPIVHRLIALTRRLYWPFLFTAPDREVERLLA